MRKVAQLRGGRNRPRLQGLATLELFSTPRPQTRGAIEYPAVALQVIWKLSVSLLPQFARLRAVLSNLNLNFKLH